VNLRRVARFAVTGAAGFATDFVTLVVLHSGLGAPLRPSLVVAYSLGGCVHYSLTRWWVFRPTVADPEIHRVARYVALAAVNAAVTVLLVPILVSHGLDYRVAKLVCVGLLFGFNYVVMPRLVMRGALRPDPADPTTLAPH
jgi:putative flippase GtrA